jgi:predicted dehydrogenase
VLERVLVVGYGSIGKRHLRVARSLLPHAEIRVLRHSACDSVPEHANGCFSRIEDALRFSPQLAVVASPAPFHLDAALPLAEGGAHLLVEKPLSIDVRGIPRLIELCERKNLVLMTGYNLRFLPSLVRFRELVQARHLTGEVLSVRCEIGQYLPSWRPDTDYRQGVSARKDLGGGALLELSHEIDYLRWIFGEIDWVKASMLRQSGLEIDVEDTVHLTLGFQGAADGRQLVACVNMDLVRHDTTRTCVAIGAEGSLRWNGLSGEVDLYRRGASAWQAVFSHPHQRDESYIAEWRHMLGMIETRTERVPLVSGQDGLRAMHVLEAARRSSAAAGRAESVADLHVADAAG